MKQHILSKPFFFKSASLLRDTILEKTGKRLLITSKPEKVKDLAFRYGSAELVDVQDTEYNSINAIKLISNKKSFSDLLIKNGLNAPSFKRTTPKEEDFPIIIRKTLGGCKGVGISVARNIEEFNKLWTGVGYWTEFINLRSEFRVHVTKSGNKTNVMRVLKKLPREGYKEPDLPIRHLVNYRFSLVENHNKRMSKLCDVVESIGNLVEANFFVLDVGWIHDSKEYFIIEGGTAPGLDNKSAEIYANYLINEGVIV